MRDILDVADSVVDAIHYLGVDVEAHHPKTRIDDLYRQRQSDVAETDHTHGQVARAEVVQWGFGHRASGLISGRAQCNEYGAEDTPR